MPTATRHARRERAPLVHALVLALSASGAACGPSADPGGPGEGGGPLHLLTRGPDLVIDEPGVVEMVGDVPGTATWGVSEGPGWSQTVQHTEEGLEYRETNERVATMFLPATGPRERHLQLALWCARPAGAEPAPVTLELNGQSLGHGDRQTFTLGRTLDVLRVEAPAQFWNRGLNALTIEVPVLEVDGRRTWDTLACARVAYGEPRRARVNVEDETLVLAAGTGVRYALELASDARIEVEAESAGLGTLTVRQGQMRPRDGRIEMEAEARGTPDDEGDLALRVGLKRYPGATRLVELTWESGDGSELRVTRLDAVEKAPVARPPIVFISIDTYAARHLSLYGYERETTPELARLAEDALVFERCIANAPWTLPSYLSVMTGLYPRAHNVPVEFQQGADIQAWDWWQLAENRWTLAEALRARGYRTAGFVDTYWLSPQYGVNQGFDLYNGDAAIAPFEDPSMGVALIVRHLLPPWLDTVGGDRPPFLFLHALDAHGPYLPEEPFRDTFHGQLAAARRQVPAGSVNQTYRTMPLWMSLTMHPQPGAPAWDEVPLEDVVARYDETILKVDHWLGVLFDDLRERGLYDDAVIVVTADHGETFGPDVYGHGVMLEDVLHVPLILKLPGNARGGERVTRPVSLVDLYPTLLELAGVPPEPARLHGRGLLDPAPAGAKDPVLFSEGGHVEQYALTWGRWRLVEERPGRESSDGSLLTHPRVPEEWLRRYAPELLERPLTERLRDEIVARPGVREAMSELRERLAGPYWSLFDLDADPDERRDLSGEKPELVEELKALLEAERARSQEARGDANPSAFAPVLSEAQQDALKALGYGGDE